jgi:pimeloyl-ACP methyl ester carboxylesterase
MNRDIRYVQTQLLNLAYEESGPTSGFPVVLLHGWPDDVRTWDGVVARLHDSGFRTITPYLRGFGPTRFVKDQSYEVANCRP